MLSKKALGRRDYRQMNYFDFVKKRDNRIVEFKVEKITNAIAKAGAATGEFNKRIAQNLTLKVLNLAQQAIIHKVPTVEEIQDVVEEVLLSSPYRKTAKAYIIHRDQHAKIREITAKAEVNLIDRYLDKSDSILFVLIGLFSQALSKPVIILFLSNGCLCPFFLTTIRGISSICS